MYREDAHLADVGDHATIVALLGEPALEALWRHPRDGFAIAPVPRRCHGLPVEIGRKDLDLHLGFSLDHGLFEEDRDRIGLFAGGAARDPDADRVVVPLVLQQFRNHLAFQRREGLRVAEELGDADQEVAEQEVELVRLVA